MGAFEFSTGAIVVDPLRKTKSSVSCVRLSSTTQLQSFLLNCPASVKITLQVDVLDQVDIRLAGHLD